MKIMVRTMDGACDSNDKGSEEIRARHWRNASNEQIATFRFFVFVAKNAEQRNMFLFGQQKNVITGRGEKMLWNETTGNQVDNSILNKRWSESEMDGSLCCHARGGKKAECSSDFSLSMVLIRPTPPREHDKVGPIVSHSESYSGGASNQKVASSIPVCI